MTDNQKPPQTREHHIRMARVSRRLTLEREPGRMNYYAPPKGKVARSNRAGRTSNHAASRRFQKPRKNRATP